MSTDDHVTSLLANVECFESSVEQLRRDLPKYFEKHALVGKQSLDIAKVLRNVATLEANQNIQSTVFLCAQKYELLERERRVYVKCQETAVNLLENAKAKMIAPAKVRELAAGCSPR